LTATILAVQVKMNNIKDFINQLVVKGACLNLSSDAQGRINQDIFYQESGVDEGNR
jgi:hypothetical protein